VAVPFGESAIVKMRDKVVEEIFDPDSFERPPPGGAPLLVNHVRDREPTGVVHSTAVRSYGLGYEAELLVSDADAEVWERRFKPAWCPVCRWDTSPITAGSCGSGRRAGAGCRSSGRVVSPWSICR